MLERNYRPCLLVGILLLVSSSAFVPSSNANARLQFHNKEPMLPAPTSASASSTQLQMGLRNFIKRKILRRKEKTEETVSASSPPRSNGNAAPPTSELFEDDDAPPAPPVRMGMDPQTGRIDVESRLGPETVQERIVRYKRGEMSQEEKEAYLKSALSTGSTPESRLPMTRGSGERNSGADSKASPFPTDSILRNIARNNVGGEPTPPVMDSQSKKKQYLDMVTDPRRFNNLSSGGATSAETTPAAASAGGEEENDGDAAPVQEEQPNLPQDLGARLGAAAMLNEKRNAENRKKQEEKVKQQELRKKQQAEHRIQVQRQRNQKLAQRELDLLQQRKEENAQQLNAQPANTQAEDSRRAELMKAQDDYWAKKLAQQQQQQANEMKPITPQVAQVESAADSSSSSSEEDATKDEEAEVKAVGETAEPPASSASPLNDVTTRSPDYMSDVMRKKAEQEDSQLAYLKNLNSPLPKRKGNTGANARTLKKATFEPQVAVNKFQPQVSASASNAAPISQTKAPSLKDLMADSAAKNKKPPVAAARSPPPPPAAPASTSAPPQKPATNRGFSPFGGFRNGAVKDKPTTQPVPQQSAPAPAPRPAARPAPQPAARAAAPNPAPSPPAPKRKGPIRMQIPLGDDEEEEPAEMREGMTIGEIMKRQKANGSSAKDQDKRSKQWGVDMSRFSD